MGCGPTCTQARGKYATFTWGPEDLVRRAVLAAQGRNMGPRVRDSRLFLRFAAGAPVSRIAEAGRERKPPQPLIQG